MVLETFGSANWLAALNGADLDGSFPAVQYAPQFAAGGGFSTVIDGINLNRINLEFSANLERLLRMLHEDERGCYRLLHLSYRHLPMPQLRGRPCAELLDLLLGLTSPEFWNSARAELRSRMDRARGLKVADAFLDCGDIRHGFARIGCENPECRHEMLLAFSCRSRYF